MCKLSPIYITFSYNQNNCEFLGKSCIEQFLKLLSHLEFKHLTIYSNFLTIDAPLLLEKIKIYNDWKISGLAVHGDFYSFKIEIEEKTILFKCFSKFFPNTIDSLAKVLAFSEFDIILLQRTFYVNSPDFDIKQFLGISKTRSSLIVKIMQIFIQSLVKICQNEILINTTFSISSLSVKFFKLNFNNFKLNFYFTIKDDAIFRKWFFGGRCEVLGNLKTFEKCFYWDYRGMYAFIMTENLPYGRYKKIADIKDCKTPGFYYVKVLSKNLELPVLPQHEFLFNDCSLKSLVFVNGEFWGLFWYEELLLFLEMGGEITKYDYMLSFDNYNKCFESYANWSFDLRNQSKIGNLIGKLLINTLFGACGMRPLENDTIFFRAKQHVNYRSRDILTETWINDEICVAVLKKKLLETDSVSSFIPIASAIAAKARIKLYKAMLAVKQKKGRVLYVDTDCIYAAYSYDVSNQSHGDVFWKPAPQGERIISAVFAAPKTYAIKFDKSEKLVIKGVSKPTILYEDFKKSFFKSQNIKQKSKHILKSSYITREDLVELEIAMNSYNKRIFSYDKLSTSPKTVFTKTD